MIYLLYQNSFWSVLLKHHISDIGKDSRQSRKDNHSKFLSSALNAGNGSGHISNVHVDISTWCNGLINAEIHEVLFGLVSVPHVYCCAALLNKDSLSTFLGAVSKTGGVNSFTRNHRVVEEVLDLLSHSIEFSSSLSNCSHRHVRHKLTILIFLLRITSLCHSILNSSTR